MIARYWKGIAYPEKVNEYLKHLEEDTFEILKQIKGFVDVRVLSKQVNDGIEFIVISTWESMDEIKNFAGEMLEKAVVPDIAKDMLVSYDEEVNHYEIVLRAIADKK